MVSNTEKVRQRKGNAICSPDSEYDRKKEPKFQQGRFCIDTKEKNSNSKDGKGLKPIPQGSCGFTVSGCL